MEPRDCPGWELRLYSRDPRFNNHQVHKVIQSYTATAADELELVLGDYIYIEQKELECSTDGWVHGTSWLTGVTGFLPAVYTRRTAESDAWTLHRAISLGTNKGAECKSESDSNTDGEMASHPHDAAELAREKSEESYKEWGKYWEAVGIDKNASISDVTHGTSIDWKANTSQTNGETDRKTSNHTNKVTEPESKRRWIFSMRHGERVDLTYGTWTPFCFDDNGTYTRQDLNMPLTLPERVGGADSFAKDTPLTRVGRLQAYLVGEGLRLRGVSVSHVYASSALRCVETAHEFINGLQSNTKIRVEPGLFEYKLWHSVKGLAPFMTPLELQKAGYNVDVDYKPYVDLDVNTTETMEEFYRRNEMVMQKVVSDTQEQGGNIMFVGHAATLDIMVTALKRLETENQEPASYQISKNLLRVPYCALAAVRERPFQLQPPPCPPSINSSSGRFNWRILLE